MGRLGNILKVAVAAMAISSCAPEEPPRHENFYETFRFRLDPETAGQMERTRGKLRASIGCHVDLAKKEIECNVPRGEAPWGNPRL